MPNDSVQVAKRRLDDAERFVDRFVAVVLDAANPAEYWIFQGADQAAVQREAALTAAAQGAKRRRIDRRARRRS